MLNRSPIVRAVDRLCRAGVRPINQQCQEISITFARLRLCRSISTAKFVSSVVTDRKTKESSTSFSPSFEYERVEADVYTIAPPKKQLTEWGQREKKKLSKTFKKMENMMETKDPSVLALLKAVEEPMVEECSYHLVTNRLKKKKVTLIDPEVCDYLCSHLGDLKDTRTAVATCLAGPGVLSSSLVRNGAKNLVLFEPNSKLRAHLEKVHEVDRNVTLTLVDQPLTEWVSDEEHPLTSRLLRNDRYDRVKILQPISHTSELIGILKNHVDSLTPYQLKDVEMFLFIQGKHAKNLLIQNGKRKSRSAVSNWWNQVFNTEEVCTLPAKAFFPAFGLVSGGAPAASARGMPTDVCMVLRARLRTETSSSGRSMTQEERPLFSLFFCHCQLTRTPVVNWLEKWAPGIGFRLLKDPSLGVGVFTRFDHLSHDQFLRVFYTFVDMVPVDNPVWRLLHWQRGVKLPYKKYS